jgi:hypothetical protein
VKNVPALKVPCEYSVILLEKAGWRGATPLISGLSWAEKEAEPRLSGNRSKC